MAQITAPVKGFTGTVVGVQFADGAGETEEVAALAYFKRHGYRIAEQESAEEFDPGKHKVDEVLDYLAGLSDDDPDARDAEVARVVEAEKAGKNRPTLLEAVEGSPEGE